MQRALYPATVGGDLDPAGPLFILSMLHERVMCRTRIAPPNLRPAGARREIDELSVHLGGKSMDVWLLACIEPEGQLT